MQDKDVKSELDPWAKLGNMVNNHEPGAVSEESLKRANEWQSVMEDVPAFGERSNDDVDNKNESKFDEQISGASRILNYVNEAPAGVDQAMETIKNFDASEYDNPWTGLKQELGIMSEEHNSKNDERREFVQTEYERKDELRRNDFMQSENAPVVPNKTSRQDFEYAIEQVKKLITNVDSGVNPKYEGLNSAAMSAGMGKFNYAVKDEKHKDIATLFGALSEMEPGEEDERIASCKNRVFKTELGPRYDDMPNVFRTNEDSVYRITGMDQIADMINCGYVRAKEGKNRGGHENEVFWSIGGDKLNYIDERPILETSVDIVKDGQIGAISLDDLTAIWIFDKESGKRENKLETIKEIKRHIGETEALIDGGGGR